MSIRTLTGKGLDEAVARAQGWIDFPTDSIEQGKVWHKNPAKAPFGPTIDKSEYRPSQDFSEAMAILEAEGISLKRRALPHREGSPQYEWVARYPAAGSAGHRGGDVTGRSPVEAILRCYVLARSLEKGLSNDQGNDSGPSP